MNLATQILTFVREMAFGKEPTAFSVEYYAVAISPKRSSVKFSTTIGLNQLRDNARSETAVKAFLQKRHPRCDIQIVRISFQ